MIPWAFSSPAGLKTASTEVEVLELTKMRQTIARRMSQSKREMPHFYVTASIDMTRAMALREELNQLYEGDVRITVNDLIVKATALALVKHPMFNSYYDDEQIKRNPSINIGIAIALEAGLVAPAILDCGSKSLKEIAVAARDLTNRAREGVLKAEEYTSATIAISNGFARTALGDQGHNAIEHALVEELDNIKRVKLKFEVV